MLVLTEMCNWFVPERVATLITPPPVRPYSAARELVMIENSSTLSMIGVYPRSLMLTLFSGTITDVPSIVISLDALRPPLIQGVVPPPGITPGASVASPNGLRLEDGRSRMALLPTTVDTLDDSV